MVANKKTEQLSLSSTMLSDVYKLNIFVVLLFSSYQAYADDYFNPDALEHRPGVVVADLDVFSKLGGQAPGKYAVNVFVNNEFFSNETLNFKSDAGHLYPEISMSMVTKLGVRIDTIPALAHLNESDNDVRLEKAINGARVDFNFDRQRLDITIPQSYLNNEVRGYVDPKEWNPGMPAGIINYNYTGSSNKYKNTEKTTNYNFLSLQNGINLGSWRLRNYSTISNSSNKSIESVYTYLQKDIVSLKSQLTIGESNTPGDIFDSLQFRGMQITSDDNQLPDSLKGYAPIIRGIAQSNSQVTIKQNGMVVYQTYVPPGPFEIKDLYPTGSQGDLDITVTGTDGKEQKFKQPFSSLPIMQREGRLKYTATLGKYRSSTTGSKEPEFSLLSAIYGLPAGNTLYSGTVIANKYQSFLIGVGHGFSELGSLSIDVNNARTSLNKGQNYQGQSYRIQYSKNIIETGTYFTLSGYRYSTNGFYDFQEANEYNYINNTYYNEHKRSRTQVSVNQNITDFGSLYLSGYIQDYWNRSGSEKNLNLGYNVNVLGINWNFGYTRTSYSAYNTKDDVFYLNMQVPLSNFLPNANLNYSLSSRKGSTIQQAGISGTALEGNKLTYNINQGITNSGQQATGSLSGSYKGSYGEFDGGYNYSSSNQQINYSLSGGIVAHQYGVTFSQRLGDTVALVRAPGASGISIENQTGVKTDWRGYAVVPYLSSYRKNRVSLDRTNMPKDVDITENVKYVVPTKGAVVLANFEPRLGSQVMMTLTTNGKPLPFGTIVTLGESKNVPYNAIVDEKGQVYLSGLPDKGSINAVWGNNSQQKCTGTFDISRNKEKGRLIFTDVECKIL